MTGKLDRPEFKYRHHGTQTLMSVFEKLSLNKASTDIILLPRRPRQRRRLRRIPGRRQQRADHRNRLRGLAKVVAAAAQPANLEQFFQRLPAKTHTVEQALHEIRVDDLASGNLFGLVYTPYCWADLNEKLTTALSSF
jgi:hypothetical protein